MNAQEFLGLVLIVAGFATLPLLLAVPLIWIERKVAARIQDRLGPNRVGPYGLIQPIADAIKLITKEDITPAGTDKFVYNVAPILSVASVVLMWAAIPLGPNQSLIGVDLEIGVLYIIAVASLGTLAVMMAGWSSNNKYALLGAFRVVAQLVSYEVPLVLSLLIPVMLAGSLSLQDMVLAQHGMWFIFMAPVAVLLFFVSAQAETGRGPFDLLEAESELVAGFNIEYSGMKFGLFFAGEFAHVMTNGVLIAHLFLGGWWGPGVTYNGPWWSTLLGIIYFIAKTSIFYFLSLLLRNSMPRVRIDQLMDFNWKFLVPISIGNLVMTSFLLMVTNAAGFGLASYQPLAEASFLDLLPVTLVLLLGNVVVVALIIGTFGRQIRQERLSVETAAAGD